MQKVVTDTTYTGKSLCGIKYNAAQLRIARCIGMSANPKHRPTFIRQWRQHRGYSLDQLAERVPMDKGNLSKIERGILPYNQDLLERLAEALMTDPASLIMRDPSQPGAIWSLWERATVGERLQIESVVEALIAAKKRA